MILYIAGLYTSHFGLQSNSFRRCSDRAKAHRASVKWNLESYHYIHKGRYAENIRRDGAKVFLDSGAFSAFSLGVDVDIGAYADFINENQDIITMASVLDAIGDHEATYRNQVELERRGCNVLPCFHYGEPMELCRYYVQNYPYITIGGMVPIPNQKLEPWLDEIWEKCLTDDNGYSITKVHGFGLTAINLMTKYPWYSVDSSSWVQAAANGLIVLPEFDKKIAVSERSPSRKNFGQHFNTFATEEQRLILEAMAKHNVDIDEVRHDYLPRWALNAYTFQIYGEQLGDDHWRKPFKAATVGLFD